MYQNKRFNTHHRPPLNVHIRCTEVKFHVCKYTIGQAGSNNVSEVMHLILM